MYGTFFRVACSMAKKVAAPQSLEEKLVAVMRSVDKQIQREMQRSPVARETHGVQKWEPIQKRMELISSIVVGALGEEAIELDSVLVFAQAMAKALQLLVDDLGEEGLGSVRSAYCLTAMERISNDMYRAIDRLKGGTQVM